MTLLYVSGFLPILICGDSYIGSGGARDAAAASLLLASSSLILSATARAVSSSKVEVER